MAHRYAILEAYLPRFDRISGRIECMMVFDAGVRCEMDGREDGGWKDEGMQQARLNPLGIGPDAEIGSRADSATSLHLTEPQTCLALQYASHLAISPAACWLLSPGQAAPSE